MLKFMKRFLMIFVLGLLLSTNAYSKTVELKKCSTSSKKFDPNQYEKKGYVINTDKSIVQSVRILTNKQYKIQQKKFMEEFGNTQGLNKINILNFQIEYSDNRFVKAVNKRTGQTGAAIEATLEIDLDDKTVFFKWHQKATGITFKCK